MWPTVPSLEIFETPYIVFVRIQLRSAIPETLVPSGPRREPAKRLDRGSQHEVAYS